MKNVFTHFNGTQEMLVMGQGTADSFLVTFQFPGWSWPLIYQRSKVKELLIIKQPTLLCNLTYRPIALENERKLFRIPFKYLWAFLDLSCCYLGSPNLAAEQPFFGWYQDNKCWKRTTPAQRSTPADVNTANSRRCSLLVSDIRAYVQMRMQFRTVYLPLFCKTRVKAL